MGTIETILTWLTDFLVQAFNSTLEFISEILAGKPNGDYAAKFGDVDEQLQGKPGGIRIGYRYGITEKESFQHLITIGATGSQKSTNVVHCTLYQSHNFSYVVHDPFKDIYKTTAAAMAKEGYEVFVLDYENPQRSIHFNGLRTCQSATAVNRLAQAISRNAQEGNQYDYWAQSSEQLIAFCANVLRQFASQEYVNLTNVLNMIQVFSYDGPAVDKWIAKHCDQKTISEYKSIVATPQKTLLSTVATALSTMRIYGDPKIAAVTSGEPFSFEDFRNKKRVLYICGSPAIAKYVKGISASFFDAFFGHVLTNISNEGYPISFLLDECALMRLDGSLPQALELGRKARINVTTLWQDYDQIEHIFGKNGAANIFANSRTKVFLPGGQPLQTLLMLEKLLGKTTSVDDDGIKKTRELLTAQEIYQLDKVLILNGNNDPLLIRPRPFWKSSKLRKLSELPVLEMPVNASSLDVPLLKF